MDPAEGVDPAREYALVERPADGIRDACNVWLESSSADLGLRLGIEACADTWDAHDIWFDLAFASGRVLSFRAPAPNNTTCDENGARTILSAGGLRFRCIEPLRRWSVSYRGTAEELSATALARGTAGFESGARAHGLVELDIDMDMAAPAWIPGTLLPEAAAILAGGDGRFMSPRYEQLLRARGTISLDGQALEFSGNGLRIRRTGHRAFSGFRGHCWQSAVFPDGRAFGFNTYPPEIEGGPCYQEGFIVENGQRTAARPIEVPWLRHLQERGDDVGFTLGIVDGRTVRISGRTYINTRSRSHKTLPAGFPIVQQAHACYEWDGERTTGMVERSSLPHLIDNVEITA